MYSRLRTQGYVIKIMYSRLCTQRAAQGLYISDIFLARLPHLNRWRGKAKVPLWSGQLDLEDTNLDGMCVSVDDDNDGDDDDWCFTTTFVNKVG